MDLKELLNEQQYLAATYLDSHLRIIAGAGSGKTRVITYRIAYLIENVGVDAAKILAITFTNKAANEMRERVRQVVGDYAGASLICTIHSLCVRILRQNINVLNYPRNFIIMDGEDQKALIKKIYNKLDIDAKTISLRSTIASISAFKMARIDAKRALELAGKMVIENKKAQVFQAYLEYQEEHFLLDFDDLLLKSVEILKEYPDIREKWQNKFQYIHVDEFQDVGPIEYELVKLLTGGAIVCVVGDPDQTIYSFRGADVNYILDFDKSFKPCKTVFLNQNYRSTSNILNISNNLIARNKNRLKKELFTQIEGGGEVIHFLAKSELDEADFVCDKIEEIISQEEGVNYSSFAVLYRSNYLSRTIEQALISRGIAYRIFGGLKFFNRKEVKDALSYLQLLSQSEDLAFERIINVPSRGIGAKTLARIQSVADKYQISLYEAITAYYDEIRLTNKTLKAVKEMVTILEKAKQNLRNHNSLNQVFEELMTDLGYITMLKDNLEENRIDNIHELQRSIYEYEQNHPEESSFTNYLQDIALYTDGDTVDNDEYVSLMSIHMAKGLEFDYVFVIGLSEGVFPNMRSVQEDPEQGIEEERRLAYVAFTRAKKQLFLSDSQGFSFVTDSPKISSRFIFEMGEQGIKHLGVRPHFKTTDYINTNLSKEELIGDNKVDSWKQGDLVNHETFGKGVVVKVNKTTLDIAFELPVGLKTIMAGHKSLKKLSN